MEDDVVLLSLVGPAKVKAVAHEGTQYLFERGVAQKAPRRLAEALIRNTIDASGNPIPEMDLWDIVPETAGGGDG